jgi:hypothetical protein
MWSSLRTTGSDAVVPAPPRVIFFYRSLGGFDVCFTTFVVLVGCTDGLGAEAGPQMYTGSTSAPTMLTGAFTSTEFDVWVGSQGGRCKALPPARFNCFGLVSGA